MFPTKSLFKNGIPFEENVYTKQIINTMTSSEALYHVSWILPDLTRHTVRCVMYIEYI